MSVGMRPISTVRSNLYAMSHYRPQPGWGKVIFSQASVILFTGGGSASVHAGIPRPPLRSACWEMRSTSGRCASYWNAILVLKCMSFPFNSFCKLRTFQVIYCVIPKGGCANWKKAILKSIIGREVTREEVQDIEFMHRHNFRRLSNYSKREINQRLKTYFKFLVVRHPMERLLSAYRSKFGAQSGVQSGFIKYESYIRRHGDGENSFSNFIE